MNTQTTAKKTTAKEPGGKAQVTPIGFRGERRVFSLAEAEELLPLVKRITHDARRELQEMKKNLDALVVRGLNRAGRREMQTLEKQSAALVQNWTSKMERLGLAVKGLWVVDFDTGDGFLCWKYPELRIAYYHGYTAGFAGRRPLREVVEETAPEWAHH